MGRLTTTERVLLALALGLTVAAGIANYSGAPGVTTFILAAGALGLLAWVVGFATEIVGERFGPAVTGVLQSSLGNAPELFVVIFALADGQIVVAETSILGSIFANGLLVLGLTIVAGARRSGGDCMRFGRRLPNDTATLLLVASFIIVLLGLSIGLGDNASKHQTEISTIGAICLLGVYGMWLRTYLRSDSPTEGHSHGVAGSAPRVPFGAALAVLAVAGVGAALVSDWFVSALDPAVESLGISKAFAGLVIVAIAGNAVENVVGITLAAKGQSELAISVVKNSVAQIATLLYPALVLVSLAFTTHLTFSVNPVLIGALVLTALSIWQITGDGEAAGFEGWALVALYVILAVVVYYE